MRGNKIAPLQHVCLTLLCTWAEGVQFYSPSRTYAAIPHCTIYSFLAHYAIPNKLSSGITVTYKSNLPYEQKGLMDDIIAKYLKGNMYGYCMMIIKATTADGIISNCHKAEEINFVNPMYVKLCLRFPKIGPSIQTKIYVYLDHDLK